MVPTHFSNLDSVLIGYALDRMAGLPSFSYGAGLNLFDNEFVAYYMSRLGAYRVDRRKRNPIYLETLKTMSNLSLQRGVNSLFFPGGTRSRSGALEKELKMGLLSSLVEAQRSIYQQGGTNKIIIIPLVISYHFVLEARLLIEQYLERKGEENYLGRDEFQSVGKILKFAWQFFSASSDIVLSFGAPMDVMGNLIDSKGNSMDKRGGTASIAEYFSTDGQIEADKQREAVYTRHLGKQIVESYHRYNVVLTSHVVAFSAFEILVHMYPDLDLFGIIRLPPDEFSFDQKLLRNVVGQVIDLLKQKITEDKVKLEDKFFTHDIDSLIADGIKKLGTYHTEKPLLMNKRDRIISKSFKLLLFYHNRLSNYELESNLQWNRTLVREALELADL